MSWILQTTNRGAMSGAQKIHISYVITLTTSVAPALAGKY